MFLGDTHDSVDIDGVDVVARRRLAIIGIDRPREIQGGKGPENQAGLGMGLATRNADDPLSSDSRFAGELDLAQLEFATFVADGQIEVKRGSDLYVGPDVVER